MIRENKPKLIVEVAAGQSTKVSLAALKNNREGGDPFKFLSIEPCPSNHVLDIHDNDFELVQKKLEDVDLNILSSADILFIDSSHVSKIGSDVNYEILELVPSLKKGSLVHWHDIVIPTNYWKEYIDNGNMFWNESYMVHAFMLYNSSFRIVWAARYMQLNHLSELSKLFPYLHEDHRLTSFWVKKI